jgi:small subunit ribosomal protein S1
MNDKPVDDDPRGQQDGEEEDFAAMLEASFATQEAEGGRLEVGEEVEGTIIHLDEDVAFVDLGGKSEGVIEVAEIFDPDSGRSIKVGDRIRAFVVSRAGGEIRLGKSMGQVRASGRADFAQIREAYERGIPVEGQITARNRGGFEVKVMGHRAFLPVSQLELGYVADPDAYVGKTFRFRIMELGERGRNIVLSRAQLLNEERERRAAETWEQLNEGDVVAGTVRSLREFGAFVDVGGVEGRVHISALSWRHVKDPSEVVAVGDVVRVKVLKKDGGPRGGRLSLSLRQAHGDPWEQARRELREGETYEGEVVRLAPFGAFVELLPGVDGLVHISEMSWTRRVHHPRDVVSEGERVKVTIRSIDWDKKRISLTMKDISADPWRDVEQRYPVGTRVTGRVEKVAPFGVFVEVEPGLTALIPNSELANRRGSEARDFPPGKLVEAQVIAVDGGERRLTLSRKALRETAERRDYDEYRRGAAGSRQQESRPVATLGDLLKAKLKQRE